jgi:predicted phage terminase large subunit-like protein
MPAASPVENIRRLEPQPGFQQTVLSTPADICIAGSGAGVGKTYALLLEATRNLDVPDYGAVIFRRETPMITNEGAMWDESVKLFAGIAHPNLNDLSWTFPPHNDKIRFSHMQLASDRFDWDGAQIPFIGFDQLEQFLEAQFWYMLSRNRTTCGVVPYIRATCNPIPEDDPIGGWLNKLVSWWIDENGYYIPERSGVIRWLVRIGDLIHWGDSRETLIIDIARQYPDVSAADIQPKSFTFIGGKLSDNQELLKRNPEYRGSLLALPKHERDRLLGGNWKSKPEAGKVFNRAWFKVLTSLPSDIVRVVRYWDKAGTQDGGKYSAGVLMGERACKRYVILNIQRGQWSAGNREAIIKTTADADAVAWRLFERETWVEQEPGSGGKESAENTVTNLAGHTVHAERVTGSKLTRSGPFASQAEAGNIDLMADLGPTINGISALEAFLNEAQNFDGEHGFTDQIDAGSGAFNKLTLGGPAAGVW